MAEEPGLRIKSMFLYNLKEKPTEVTPQKSSRRSFLSKEESREEADILGDPRAII